MVKIGVNENTFVRRSRTKEALNYQMPARTSPAVAVTKVSGTSRILCTGNPTLRENGLLARAQLRDCNKHYFRDNKWPLQACGLLDCDVPVEDAGLPRRKNPALSPSNEIDDPTVRALNLAMDAVLANDEPSSRLAIYHISLALAAHIAARYGALYGGAKDLPGGLANWQIRHATGRLAASLDGSVPISALAKECRLSPSHFTRAFRRSTGLTPLQWLMCRRIEVAFGHLQAGYLTLAEVAIESGFADQSHFTRVFTKLTGISPARWRRAHE